MKKKAGVEVARRQLLTTISLSAFLFIALSGCATETREGDSVSFSFALWVPMVTMAVCFLGMVAGLILCFRSAYWWILALGAPLFGVVIVPALFLDQATITPEAFHLRTGIWFVPRIHHVELANVQQVEIISEVNNDRKKTTSHYLLCSLKTGGAEKIPLGDLMRNGPSEEFLRVARHRGIPVFDRR